MIPDKIYTFQDDGDRYWYKPEEWETPPLTRVEYIRKDALLDFLAGLEKDSARNAGTDDLAYAAHEMVCLLINKIKSL